MDAIFIMLFYMPKIRSIILIFEGRGGIGAGERPRREREDKRPQCKKMACLIRSNSTRNGIGVVVLKEI